MSSQVNHAMVAVAPTATQQPLNVGVGVGVGVAGAAYMPAMNAHHHLMHAPAPLNMHNAPSAAAAEQAANAKRHRESYTVREKILMVRKYQSEIPQLSVRKFAQVYGIPANTFKHWVQLYEQGVPDELKALESQSRRRIRPGKYPQLERRVVDFLKARAPHEPKVHWSALRERCEDWAKELPDDERADFTLTNGWIARVLKRNSLLNVEGGDMYPFSEFHHMDGSGAHHSGVSGYEDISERFLSKKRAKYGGDSTEIPDYPSDVALQLSAGPPVGVGVGVGVRNGVNTVNGSAAVSANGEGQTASSSSSSSADNNNNNNNNSSNAGGGNIALRDAENALNVVMSYARNHRLFDVLDTAFQLALRLRDHSHTHGLTHTHSHTQHAHSHNGHPHNAHTQLNGHAAHSAHAHNAHTQHSAHVSLAQHNGHTHSALPHAHSHSANGVINVSHHTMSHHALTQHTQQQHAQHTQNMHLQTSATMHNSQQLAHTHNALTHARHLLSQHTQQLQQQQQQQIHNVLSAVGVNVNVGVGVSVSGDVSERDSAQEDEDDEGESAIDSLIMDEEARHHLSAI